MADVKRAQSIIDDHLEQIATGGVRPGERLPTEAELAERYGVSRSAVREAIHMLAAKGFVKVRQGSGTTIAPRSEWNELDPEYVRIGLGREVFSNLIEARETLEPMIAALAAKRARPADVEELQRLVARADAIGANPDAHADADIAFHEALAHTSANPLLVAMHASLTQIGHRARASSVRVAGAVDRAITWHRHIVEAVAAGDPDAAGDAMRMHLRQVRADLNAALLLLERDRVDREEIHDKVLRGPAVAAAEERR